MKGHTVTNHLEDLKEMGLRAHDVPYGAGVANTSGILEELKAQGFENNLSIKYKYHWDDSAPEVPECSAFVRGDCAARKS